MKKGYMRRGLRTAKLNFVLERSMYEQIQRIADREGVNISEVTRTLLQYGLDNLESDLPTESERSEDAGTPSPFYNPNTVF